MQRNKNQKEQQGFTLLELMVVIAIIALISSIALIAFQQAREKSRDAKRLGDMTQMNTGLELYFANYKGYPSETAGIPNIGSDVLSTIPTSPIPPDGTCALPHSAACTTADAGCTNTPANQYYYVPSGTPTTMLINGNNVSVYPDYQYFFCLGAQTGNFPAGERILTSEGLK